jgi:hypothetical protein
MKSWCVGLQWLGHSKTQEKHDNVSWFGLLLSPTSSSALFFMLRSTKIGDYNNGDRGFGKGSLSANLRLVEDVLL